MAVPGALWAQHEDAPPGPPPGPEEMEPPESDEIIGTLKRDEPEVFEHLQQIRRARPDAFRNRLREMRPMLRDPEFRKSMIGNFKLEMRLRKLTEGYREAKDEKEKARIKDELKTALEEQFDSKLAAQEMRLKRMEQEIGELRKRVEKRRKDKKKLVENRLGVVTGAEEGWDW
ncbi:MAG: hypothetical protein WC728_15395 [Elusimicrobiota bacterium]